MQLKSFELICQFAVSFLDSKIKFDMERSNTIEMLKKNSGDNTLSEVVSN